MFLYLSSGFLEVELLGHMVRLYLYFLGNCQVVFQRGYTDQQFMRVPAISLLIFYLTLLIFYLTPIVVAFSYIALWF